MSPLPLVCDTAPYPEVEENMLCREGVGDYGARWVLQIETAEGQESVEGGSGQERGFAAKVKGKDLVGLSFLCPPKRGKEGCQYLKCEDAEEAQDVPPSSLKRQLPLTASTNSSMASSSDLSVSALPNHSSTNVNPPAAYRASSSPLVTTTVALSTRASLLSFSTTSSTLPGTAAFRIASPVATTCLSVSRAGGEAVRAMEVWREVVEEMTFEAKREK
jgi:hypothetical protein